MSEGTLIVGGGIAGLGVGWKLAQRGETVTILEKGEAGREASWAAAGMLAPATEAHFQEDCNLSLGQESMRLYPDFVAELESFSGQTVDYRSEGALALALDADDTAVLKELYQFQTERKLPVRWLSGDEAREMEPGLSNYICAGIYCPMDHQLDNRKLLEALKTAFIKAGGELREQTEVTRVECNGGFKSVRAGEREWKGKRLVLAAGSWSGIIPGLPENVRPPVRPVRGQMFSLIPPSPDFLTHVIRAPEVYMAPKKAGYIVCGSTMEEMGFDRSLTAGGLYKILKGAWETLPGTYELSVKEMWTGFRPGSRDNSPLIGESEIPGIYLATGHHRGGILFTPATAIYLSDLILEGRTSEHLLPFDPKRFGK